MQYGYRIHVHCWKHGMRPAGDDRRAQHNCDHCPAEGQAGSCREQTPGLRERSQRGARITRLNSLLTIVDAFKTYSLLPADHCEGGDLPAAVCQFECRLRHPQAGLGQSWTRAGQGGGPCNNKQHCQRWYAILSNVQTHSLSLRYFLLVYCDFSSHVHLLQQAWISAAALAQLRF